MIRKGFLAAVLCLSLAAPCGAAESPATSPRLLLHAGAVLDVRTGRLARDQGILVADGRILEVAPWKDPGSRQGTTDRIVDLSTATVMPGLVDCHAHLLAAMDGRLGPAENIIQTVTSLSLARRALLGAAHAREMLQAGFTSVRIVGHSGYDGDVALRDAIASGSLPGPRILASGRKITPPGGQGVSIVPALEGPLLDQEFLPVSGSDEARRAVRENLAAGVDLLKVVADDPPRTLSVGELKAIVEEAHAAGKKVAAHATTRQGIRAAVEAGVDSVEHGDEADEEILLRMKRSGIFLVPTSWTRKAFEDLLRGSVVLTREDEARVSSWLSRWEETSRRKMTLARKVGVKIAAGSDMWFRYPGMSRGEASLLMLEAMHREGMTPIEVLRSVTIGASDLLGLGDKLGAVEPGRIADLIAVPGDPSRDLTLLRRVSFVMKEGKIVRGDPSR